MREYEYHFYNGDGEPPYIETKWFLTRPGSRIIFTEKEYEVMCWMLNERDEDDEDTSPITIVCELKATFDEEACIKSMMREQKLNSIGI